MKAGSITQISTQANKQRTIVIVTALLLLALLAAGLIFVNRAASADSADRHTKGGNASASLSVTLASAQTSNWSSSLYANGSIAAWQESIIGTELNGVRLVELLAQVGDRVKRGQLLARFSDDLLHTEQAQQSAALAEAEATLAEAQSNARRALQLKESGAISVQQITQYATARNTAAARVSAARAGLSAAKLRLQQARISAPDDGVISARSATVGAVAQSGQELFRLIRQGKLEWRAEVTAEESSRLQPGQSASIFSVDGGVIPGKIRMVAPTVDPQTRKALVYVDLNNSPAVMQQIRPGMFAKGEFLMGASSALSVPASALVMRDGYASVFVLDGNNKVKQVRVSAGRTQQGRVEITSGLGPNAKVVDSGAGFLADGDTVRVVAAASQPKLAPPSSGASLAASGK